jgi:ComF family protein
MLLLSTCAGCNAPGDTLCRRCRFALVSSSSVAVGDGVRAAMPFDGVGRAVVHGLKFRNRRAVARQLAGLMVRRLLPEAVRGDVDLVTWAPTSSARVAERGFDQAELLARAVARELGVPCRRLLYRSHGRPQSGRGRAARLVGPSFRGRAPGRGLRVLLVDDVVTTGGTLHAAQRALLDAGVAEVRCIAAAATPEATPVRPVLRLAS